MPDGRYMVFFTFPDTQVGRGSGTSESDDASPEPESSLPAARPAEEDV
jgi:hypothetical protein